jgi:hypothetical protein
MAECAEEVIETFGGFALFFAPEMSLDVENGGLEGV